MNRITTWREALGLIEAGGVMRGHQITMPDGRQHDCWMQVRFSLERRGLLTSNPAGTGWVLKRKPTP